LLGRVVSIERNNRNVELLASGPNRLIAALLQSSDRVTSVYLRLAAYWPDLFQRRAKCRV
jgi:hypothetical protein